MKRLFLGIAPAEPSLETLSGFQNELKAHLGAQAEAVRWNVHDSLHLTLHFLGEMPPSRVDTLRRELFKWWARRGKAKVFSLTLDRWLALPSPARAQVLALGATVVPPELLEWHESLGALLREQRFKIEARPYLPHITLGRCKAQAFALPGGVERVGPFVVQNLTLFESIRGETGAEYLPVQEFRIAS